MVKPLVETCNLSLWGGVEFCKRKVKVYLGGGALSCTSVTTRCANDFCAHILPFYVLVYPAHNFGGFCGIKHD